VAVAERISHCKSRVLALYFCELVADPKPEKALCANPSYSFLSLLVGHGPIVGGEQLLYKGRVPEVAAFEHVAAKGPWAVVVQAHEVDILLLKARYWQHESF